MNKQKLKILFLLFVFLSGCEKKNEELTHQSPKSTYFSKTWKADIDFVNYQSCAVYRDAFNNLVAIIYSQTDIYESMSYDNGITWSPSVKIFDFSGLVLPIIVQKQLLGVQTFKNVDNGGQSFFHIRTKNGWKNHGAIRDTYWGNFGGGAFAKDLIGNIYCAWTDYREGNADVYFSSSTDRGKSWNLNVRINDDQSGQAQALTCLLSSPEGILYAFWEDNRNPKTLFDIYFSTSRDNGKTWSTNIKINDDTTHCWQKAANAVLDQKGDIYVAWYDYRDRGVHKDVIGNIYFSKSKDGGKTWSKNVRISHAKTEHCLNPKLTIVNDNKIHCTWGSYDSKHYADVYYSYSENSGLLWSQPIRVNDNLKRLPLEHRAMGALPDSAGNVIVGWFDKTKGKEAIYLTKTIKSPDSSRIKRKQITKQPFVEIIPSLRYTQENVIFSDDFENGISELWQQISGFWVCKDQMYIGYGSAKSFVNTEPLSDFLFSGKFKLDLLNHQAACFYIRINNAISPEKFSYYRIVNFFRVGVTLDYFNGNSFSNFIEIPYPFQKNTWYSFRAVMKGEVLNYFINDSLILTKDKLYYNNQGRLGIGTGAPPAYFKDINITSIK